MMAVNNKKGGSKMKTLTLKETKVQIEKLGDLRRDIKEMQLEEKEICRMIKEPFYRLIEKGLDAELSTKHYNCTFDKHERDNVNWKALAIELGATRKQIRKYTKTSQIERFVITQK
jgi:hypothetical protein